MDESLHARYREASDLAAAYCRYLYRRHGGNLLGLRAELRRFFRLAPHRRREYIRSLQ
jgi:hypothetical protein